MSLYTIRDVAYADRAFIVDSWRSAYGDAPAVQGMRPQAYRLMMPKHIVSVLERPDTRTLVACSPNDHDTILGWAAFAGCNLHFAYVKSEVRKNGIFRAMLEGHQIDGFTHKPRRWNPPADWSYRPIWLL